MLVHIYIIYRFLHQANANTDINRHAYANIIKNKRQPYIHKYTHTYAYAAARNTTCVHSRTHAHAHTKTNITGPLYTVQLLLPLLPCTET